MSPAKMAQLIDMTYLFSKGKETEGMGKRLK